MVAQAALGTMTARAALVTIQDWPLCLDLWPGHDNCRRIAKILNKKKFFFKKLLGEAIGSWAREDIGLGSGTGTSSGLSSAAEVSSWAEENSEVGSQTGADTGVDSGLCSRALDRAQTVWGLFVDAKFQDLIFGYVKNIELEGLHYM